jgi:hypothetical protein
MTQTRARARPHWSYRLFFVLVFVPMMLVFPYHRATNNPNELVRVFTVMSLVEQHTFSVDDQVEQWGWVNDMAHVKSKVDGRLHYFMVKGPLVVYAGVPGYFVFSKIVAPLVGHTYPGPKSTPDERLWWLRMATWALRLSTTQLPCFLFLLWFERYLRDFASDPRIRWTAVAACALGTNFLAYVHMFASHSPYAAVAFTSFALTERELRLSRGHSRDRRLSRAALAGFCASACVALEYQSLFVAIILTLFGVAVFWRPTRLVAFGIGGLLNVLPVMYFHWKAYGNPLTPGHQMLETQSWAASMQKGLWGIVWPSWEHIQSLAVDPSFGFFGMSPFMWIGLAGVPLLLLSPGGVPSRRRAVRRATSVWVLCAVALFGVNAGFFEYRAGWTVGPRYLVAAAPFFAFGCACVMDRLAAHSPSRRALVGGVGGGLALASVISIGTVGLVFDTLPEAIQRPFAQFAYPMALTGFVPHHVLEWFGVQSSGPWYAACLAMLLAPVFASLWRRHESGALYSLRVTSFVIALALGMVPALSTTEDGSALFVLHPSVRGFPQSWEPAGRDRITLLRNEAERYGPRRPCLWYRLADLDSVIGDSAQAARDTHRAGSTPREDCPRTYY